jgi:hypothetical protein
MDTTPSQRRPIGMNHVTIKKFAQLTGYSEDAARAKTKNGTWIYKVHFHKAPDGRILLDLVEIEKWIKSTKE